MKNAPKRLGCRVVEGNMFLRCADCGRMISGRDYAVGEETTQECPARWKSLAEQLDGTVRAGRALYDAIVSRLAPHYPAGSRDLEWDVLPATLAALAREREELRLTLAVELGDTKAAPEGWTYASDGFDERGDWTNADGTRRVWWNGEKWVWGRRVGPGAYTAPKRQPRRQAARAAMIAAGKARP